MRDRDLVRLYWPVELRPAFDALMGIDDAMAEVVATTTQPALGAIRLTWWRDALERLDRSPPPPEPRLQAVATELLPRGISGSSLAGLEAGWAALLDEQVDPNGVAKRGETLFAAGARLLGGQNDVGAAGRAFALAEARKRGVAVPLPDLTRVAKSRRPLTALTVLSLRPVDEPDATPGKAWALLRHRWTGRFPKTD